MFLKNNKKGNVMGTLITILFVIVMVVASGFALSIGASILSTQQSTQATNSYAYNASGFALQGVNTFAQQMPSIAGIGVLVVIIGLLIGGVLGVLYLKNRF